MSHSKLELEYSPTFGGDVWGESLVFSTLPLSLVDVVSARASTSSAWFSGATVVFSLWTVFLACRLALNSASFCSIDAHNYWYIHPEPYQVYVANVFLFFLFLQSNLIRNF